MRHDRGSNGGVPGPGGYACPGRGGPAARDHEDRAFFIALSAMSFADAAVVGSALVQAVAEAAEAGEPVAGKVESFVRTLRGDAA